MTAPKKLTTKAAITQVLAANGKPMKVKDIIAGAVPLTALGGKSPGQTVYSILYSEAKKPGPLFVRVGRGEFELGQMPAATEPVKSAAAKPEATKPPTAP